VLVSARFQKVKGKKYFINRMIKDRFRTILAIAKALWIQPKLNRKL
jgi:hypothetical protein